MSRKRPAPRALPESPCGGSPVPLVIPRCDAEGRRAVNLTVDNHISAALGGDRRARLLARRFAYTALAVVIQRGDPAPFFFLSAAELDLRLRTCSDDAAVEIHVFDNDGFASKISAALQPHGIASPYHWIEELSEQVGYWLTEYIRLRDSHVTVLSAQRALQLYLLEHTGARALPPGSIVWAADAK